MVRSHRRQHSYHNTLQEEIHSQSSINGRGGNNDNHPRKRTAFSHRSTHANSDASGDNPADAVAAAAMASSAAPSRTVSLKEKAAALRAGDVDAIIERALRAIGLDPADPRSATAQIPFDRLPRSMHQSLAKFLKITTSSIPVIHSGTPEQGIVMTQLVEFVSLMDKNAVQFDPTVPHSFILLHNSQQVGTITTTLPPLLKPRATVFHVATIAIRPTDDGNPASDRAARDLISRFANGLAVVLHVSTCTSGTLAIAGPTFAVPLRPIAGPIIQRTACSFPAPSPAAASGAKARAKITLVNPFSIAVRVARVSARVAVDGVFLATSQNDVDFTLPAGSVAFDDPAHPGRPVPRPSEEFCTPPLVAWLDVSWKAVAAVVRRFRGGTLKVSVWCEVEAFVGTFRTTLEFIQDDVPVSFVWSIS